MPLLNWLGLMLRPSIFRVNLFLIGLLGDILLLFKLIINLYSQDAHDCYLSISDGHIFLHDLETRGAALILKDLP